jgi:RNA polymerase sigma factor (sigma-70 family)
LREASGLGRVYDSGVGNARRVEELYTAHIRVVRAVCRSLLRDRNEAEDAVQQTFLSAQRALANGSSPREPAAWLATIARNECFARVRERMREPLPVDFEPTVAGGDVHAAAVSRYEVATLREALADLPRAQREAILLRELRGLSYDEVARALSVTTAAVESLIFRARRTLQVRLSEALSALSPIALLGRLLGGGGDLAGPAVAKVAAIGVGAAVLAGGAALGPHTFGLGHAVRKVQHTAPRVDAQAAAPAVLTSPAHIWSKPTPGAVDTHETERETAASESISSADVVETSSPESSSPETEKESPAVTTTATTPTTPTAPLSTDDGATDDSADSGN